MSPQISLCVGSIEIRFDESMPEGDRGRIAVCERARTILGWRPTIDFEAGIERTYRWVEQEIEKKSESRR